MTDSKKEKSLEQRMLELQEEKRECGSNQERIVFQMWLFQCREARDMSNLAPFVLDEYLSKFLLYADQDVIEKYDSTSFSQFLHSLDVYLKSKNYLTSILTDQQFTQCRKALTIRCKQLRTKDIEIAKRNAWLQKLFCRKNNKFTSIRDSLEQWLREIGETEDIYMLPPVSLNYYLMLFFYAAKKPASTRCNQHFLKDFLFTLNQYLEVNRYSCSLLTSQDFIKTRQIVDLKCKLQEGSYPNVSLLNYFLPMELQYLYEWGILGCKCPEILLRTLFLLNNQYFSVGNLGTSHSKLLWGDIRLCKQEQTGQEFLRFFNGKQVNDEHDDSCSIFSERFIGPVEAYKTYMSYRPPEMNTPDAPFYLMPNDEGKITDGVQLWYRCRKLSDSKFKEFVEMIKEPCSCKDNSWTRENLKFSEQIKTNESSVLKMSDVWGKVPFSYPKFTKFNRTKQIEAVTTKCVKRSVCDKKPLFFAEAIRQKQMLPKLLPKTNINGSCQTVLSVSGPSPILNTDMSGSSRTVLGGPSPILNTDMSGSSQTVLGGPSPILNTDMSDSSQKVLGGPSQIILCSPFPSLPNTFTTRTGQSVIGSLRQLQKTPTIPILQTGPGSHLSNTSTGQLPTDGINQFKKTGTDQLWNTCQILFNEGRTSLEENVNQRELANGKQAIPHRELSRTLGSSHPVLLSFLQTRHTVQQQLKNVKEIEEADENHSAKNDFKENFGNPKNIFTKRLETESNPDHFTDAPFENTVMCKEQIKIETDLDQCQYNQQLHMTAFSGITPYPKYLVLNNAVKADVVCNDRVEKGVDKNQTTEKDSYFFPGNFKIKAEPNINLSFENPGSKHLQRTEVNQIHTDNSDIESMFPIVGKSPCSSLPTDSIVIDSSQIKTELLSDDDGSDSVIDDRDMNDEDECPHKHRKINFQMVC